MNSMHQEIREVGRVGIVGANATGIGIAVSLLDAGVPVTLLEPERESLDSGTARVRAGYRDAVAQGELAQAEGDRRIALLAGTVHFHHLKDCDLIVDALDTGAADKESLFRRLDQVAKPGAVLATQASQAGVDHIAGYTRRWGEVLGLDVASSPDTEAAWRIVPGKDTSSGTLDTVALLAGRVGKAAVVCGAA